jgi:hypothetical protein
VLEWLRKLCADIIVAAIADLALALCEQVPRGLRLVNRMAGCTTDVSLRMRTSANVGAIDILGMAPQAGIEDPTGRQLGESDDRRFPTLRLNVATSGTMAALTAGILQTSVPRDCALVVRIAEELQRNGWMTGEAGASPDIAGGARWGWCLRVHASRHQPNGQGEGGMNCSLEDHEPYLPI